MSFWSRVTGSFRALFGAGDADFIDGASDGVHKALGSGGGGLVGGGAQGLEVGASPHTVPDASDDEPIGIYADPFLLGEQYGYRPRPSALSFSFIDNVYFRLAPVAAVVQTRLGQLGRYFTPQPSRYEAGYRVVLSERRAVPTAADRKYIHQIEQILLRTGVTPDARLRPSFMKQGLMMMRDSLLYDQCALQVVTDPNTGLPTKWYAMDAKTIYLADTRRLTPVEDLDTPYAVQVWNGVPIEEFSLRNLAFGVRNPSTDIRAAGYGTPEIALLVQVVTGLLDAISYNLTAFSQGSLQKGLLAIKGNMPPKRFAAFRKIWYTLISGRSNWWRPPVVNAEDVKWVSMNTTNKEMEFAALMDFLLRLTTAVFLMDPTEVGFRFGGQGGARQQMFAGADKSKINESKDKGLKPLLIFIADIYNRWVVWPMTQGMFSLEFVGLDTMTPKERADLDTQRVRSVMTPNEVRAEQDLAPVKYGDSILDPNISLARRDDMMQEQAEMAAQSLASPDDIGLPQSGVPGGGGGVPGVKGVKLSPGETDGPSIGSDEMEPATSERMSAAKSLVQERGFTPELWNNVLLTLDDLADEAADMEDLADDLQNELDSAVAGARKVDD